MKRETIQTLSDRAMLVMFREPGLGYSRALRASMDRDPLFVQEHRSEVVRNLHEILKMAGYLMPVYALERQTDRIVREVVGRLRSYERNEGVTSHENKLSGMVMHRQRNTTATGEPFNTDTIVNVWEKGSPELWFTFFKRDRCGATIEKGEFGKQSEYGWEIDHVVPVSKGGTDDLSNLQPLHWKNNLAKGDAHPNWNGIKGG